MMVDDKLKTTTRRGWRQMLLSVCSAFFGVQSDKNLTADFSNDRFWPYVLIGLGLVVAFILLLVLLVKLILFLA